MQIFNVRGKTADGEGYIIIPIEADNEEEAIEFFYEDSEGIYEFDCIMEPEE